jgi:ATP-dependent DNA ligase
VFPLRAAFPLMHCCNASIRPPSRVQRLASETPAIYVVFDLLAAEDGRSLLVSPATRRAAKAFGAIRSRLFRQ